MMICIPAKIPLELSAIDEELKAIYHSKDSFCIWVFTTKTDSNQFIEATAGMNKVARSDYYVKNYT